MGAAARAQLEAPIRGYVALRGMTVRALHPDGTPVLRPDGTDLYRAVQRGELVPEALHWPAVDNWIAQKWLCHPSEYQGPIVGPAPETPGPSSDPGHTGTGEDEDPGESEPDPSEGTDEGDVPPAAAAPADGARPGGRKRRRADAAGGTPAST